VELPSLPGGGRLADLVAAAWLTYLPRLDVLKNENALVFDRDNTPNMAFGGLHHVVFVRLRANRDIEQRPHLRRARHKRPTFSHTVVREELESIRGPANFFPIPLFLVG
jgi:hypothetical protein